MGQHYSWQIYLLVLKDNRTNPSTFENLQRAGFTTRNIKYKKNTAERKEQEEIMLRSYLKLICTTYRQHFINCSN